MNFNFECCPNLHSSKDWNIEENEIESTYANFEKNSWMDKTIAVMELLNFLLYSWCYRTISIFYSIKKDVLYLKLINIINLVKTNIIWITNKPIHNLILKDMMNYFVIINFKIWNIIYINFRRNKNKGIHDSFEYCNLIMIFTYQLKLA